MSGNKKQLKTPSTSGPSVFNILGNYRGAIAGLAILSVASNGLALWQPKIISKAIDAYAHGNVVLSDVALLFGAVSMTIFVLAYMQSIVQTYVSERVARDMRNQLADKISRQSYSFVQETNPSRLLTNLTSDMDAVKLFVAQALVSIISSIVLIVGASILLINIYWKLALAVLAILPLIGITFYFTLRRVNVLFLRSRAVVDKLNRVISESILGAAIIRVLFSQSAENKKFASSNAESRDIGYSIIKIFATLIPSITLLANLTTLTILLLGGHFVIARQLSLGDYAAFTSYIAILIFPIIVLGFIGNIIAQANASYARIAEVLSSKEPADDGTLAIELTGRVEARNISMNYGDKSALKDISFVVNPGSRTAIIGPTAAGKSQLLYVLTGLIQPSTGSVLYDNQELEKFNKTKLHSQVGFVFQDSIIFNMSLRENISFSSHANTATIEKAIQAAELSDLVSSLPRGLETSVSERGTSLSGGQKQRLMLARALVLDPKILLLDDFTARVDTVTESKILANIARLYPDLTLLSVTQKIVSVEDYDQVILLMEGELLAKGTHQQLLASSPEYMQIYNSQRSTTEYELQSN